MQLPNWTIKQQINNTNICKFMNDRDQMLSCHIYKNSL